MSIVATAYKKPIFAIVGRNAIRLTMMPISIAFSTLIIATHIAIVLPLLPYMIIMDDSEPQLIIDNWFHHNFDERHERLYTAIDSAFELREAESNNIAVQYANVTRITNELDDEINNLIKANSLTDVTELSLSNMRT